MKCHSMYTYSTHPILHINRMCIIIMYTCTCIYALCYYVRDILLLIFDVTYKAPLLTFDVITRHVHIFVDWFFTSACVLLAYLDMLSFALELWPTSKSKEERKQKASEASNYHSYPDSLLCFAHLWLSDLMWYWGGA